MQFSLDCKRRSHKHDECSASDSVGLILTRSHRCRRLITTSTMALSLVKSNHKIFIVEQRINSVRYSMKTELYLLSAKLSAEL